MAKDQNASNEDPNASKPLVLGDLLSELQANFANAPMLTTENFQEMMLLNLKTQQMVSKIEDVMTKIQWIQGLYQPKKKDAK